MGMENGQHPSYSEPTQPMAGKSYYPPSSPTYHSAPTYQTSEQARRPAGYTWPQPRPARRPRAPAPSSAPQPRRAGLPWRAIALATSALLIACCVCGALLSRAPRPTTRQTGVATTTTTPRASPARRSSHHAVGETVRANDVWEVAVTDVSTSQGDRYVHPKSDETYLTLALTFHNISSQPQSLSTFVGCQLRDSTGLAYGENLYTPGVTLPDGNVDAAAQARGQVAYTVPQSARAFVFSFTPGFGATPVYWDITRY